MTDVPPKKGTLLLGQGGRIYRVVDPSGVVAVPLEEALEELGAMALQGASDNWAAAEPEVETMAAPVDGD